MCAYGPLLPLSHNAALIHLAVFPLPLFKLLFRYIYINPSLNLPDIIFHGGIFRNMEFPDSIFTY